MHGYFMLNAHRNKSDSFLNFINYVDETGSSHELQESHINWMGNLDRASQLGVDSIIFHRMKQGEMLSRVPEWIVDRFKVRFYWNQARNMKRFGRLKEVLDGFSLEEIPVIALKGAVLAQLVYDHMGLRPMNDVDLLVHEKDLSRAERLLISLGFHASEGIYSKEWFQKHHHHIVPYVSKDGSLIIELHHHLIAYDIPVVIPNEDLWERSYPVQITGVACRMLSLEDLLIHLSLHLAVDQYCGKMRVLYDLAETIKHYQKEIDWDRLINIVNGYRISKYLYYAFWLAQVTVRADVPSQVLSILRDHVSGLPMEDRFLKAAIRKVVVHKDKNKYPFSVWILETACVDIFSNRKRIEKLRNIIRLWIKQYQDYSHIHAQQIGVSPAWYLMVGYPVYLLRKAMGLSTSLEMTQAKKS